MEWSREACLQLIELYRKYDCLWDPRSENYKHKNKKEDAWKDIADIMSRTVMDIRKKLESLLASFRRERQRSLPSKTDRSRNYPSYTSKWFAYKRMLFLLNRPNPKWATDTLVDNLDDTVNVNLKISKKNSTLLPTVISEPHHETSSEQMRPIRKKRKYKDCTLDGGHHVEEQRVETSSSSLRDVSAVFGEYLAAKHRGYSAQTRSTVEYMISNILYKADSGNYETDPISNLPSPIALSVAPLSPSFTESYNDIKIEQI